MDGATMLVRIAKNKENPYVMINKHAMQDSSLSFKARGLLGYCMSMPDDWKFNINQIAHKNECGIDQVKSGFKELIDKGYCVREKDRKQDGTFTRTDYVLYETPNLKESLPQVGFPLVEVTPPGLYKDILSTEDTKKNKQKEKAASPPIAPDVAALTSFFYEELLKGNPKIKKPLNLYAENKAFLDLLKDNSISEIREVINFAFKHDFWSRVMKNGRNFNKNFASMWKEMKLQVTKSERNPTERNKKLAEEFLRHFSKLHHNHQISKEPEHFCIFSGGVNHSGHAVSYSISGFEDQVINHISKISGTSELIKTFLQKKL